MVFSKCFKKGRSKKISYGYGRFSLLGAIVNAVVLFSGSIFIITEAIPRLTNPETPDTQGMIYLAILGVVVNGAAVIKLKKGVSINEKVVSLHLLEDVLGWIAVLIGAIIMHYYDAPIIDPILSLGISAFILFNVFRNLKQSFRIILQGTPKDISINKLISTIEKIDGVKSIHDCHMWTLEGEQNIFSAHLVVDENHKIKDLVSLKKEVRKLLHDAGVEHATLEFETEEEDCHLEDC